MQHLRAFLFLSLLAMACCQGFALDEASDKAIANDPRFAFVDVPVCKASIYIGSVTMTTGRFERQGDHYLTTYQANVFPFFFYKEKGKISIQIDSGRLSKLARGENIQFEGTATTQSGQVRRIEGSAVPAEPNAGKLMIKIYVTRSIRLSFTTSYKLAGLSTTTTSPASK